MRKLIIALVVLLGVTVGSFAYAYTDDTAGIAVSPAGADFVDVSANSSFGVNYNLLGSVLGSIGNGVMFNAVGDASYTGDIIIRVTLMNADELTDEYAYWIARVSVRDSQGSIISRQGIQKLISLHSPEVTFIIDNVDIAGKTVDVTLDGGGYLTFPYTILGGKNSDPILFCSAGIVGD